MERSRSERDSRRCSLESGSSVGMMWGRRLVLKWSLGDGELGESEDNGRMQVARNAETDFVTQK
jgi:hypothetical protein